MTNNPISAAAIIFPNAGIAKPWAAPERISGADIVVAPFTAAPAAPKLTSVSAQISTGGWPPSAETLAAIKADLDVAGTDAKKDVRGHLLIASCINRGVDAGCHIRQVGIELGFNAKHIGLLLHAASAPWHKGPDGRYKLI
jgi:hypothetical protein